MVKFKIPEKYSQILTFEQIDFVNPTPKTVQKDTETVLKYAKNVIFPLVLNWARVIYQFCFIAIGF